MAATDDDDDTLTYSLGGNNATSFAIDSTTGQLKTSAELNYERENTYKVTISVSDGNEGSDTINVTIKVKDVVDIYTPLSERTPAVTQEIVRRISSARTADDVGDKDLRKVTTLTLRSKEISELKSNDFNGLTKVQHLWLTNNPLTTLPSGLFNGMTELSHLALYSNSISSLPADIFDGLTARVGININLSYNDLTSVPDGIFDGLTTLGDLEFRDNTSTLVFPFSFRKASDGVYKATAQKEATFDMELPVTITNGYMLGGATSITISKGSLESSNNTNSN